MSIPIQKDTFPIPNSRPNPPPSLHSKKLRKSRLIIYFQCFKLFPPGRHLPPQFAIWKRFFPLSETWLRQWPRIKPETGHKSTTLGHNCRENRHKCKQLANRSCESPQRCLLGSKGLRRPAASSCPNTHNPGCTCHPRCHHEDRGRQDTDHFCGKLVPKARLELARYCYRRILNPLRLPFRHLGTEHSLAFPVANVQIKSL